MTKRIIAFALSVIMVFVFSSCSADAKYKTNSLGIKVGTEIPKYVHYDPENFYSDVEKLMDMASADDTEELLKLYDSLYGELLYIIDLSWSVYIDECEDSQNESLAEEYVYISDVVTVAKDKFCTAAHEISIGKNAQLLKEHVNSDGLFENYVNYVPYSDELIELMSEEKTLVNEYLVMKTDSEDFYNASGEIYVKLVKIRDQIAKELGYDNFNDYADEVRFRRDFTQEDLEPFYQAAKDIDITRLDGLLDFYYSYYPYYDRGGKESAEDLKKAVKGISSYVDEAVDFMIRNDLYFFGTDTENNMDMGYTQPFRSNNTAFVYNLNLGEFDDLNYLAHELGHFTNSYLIPMTDPIFNEGNYDILEVHSQGLEFLAANSVGELCGAEMKTYGYCNVLGNIESCIMSGCLYDEWQRTIYKNPDMTIEEIDSLYIELCKEYGLYSEVDAGIYWRLVPHNFENPLYYISYATSCLAALQIWELSLTDFDAATEIYNKVLLTNPYTTSYFEMIENCGLWSFTDGEKVSNLVKEAMNYAENGIIESLS